MRLVIPIESIDHAAHELVRLGAEAEVLAPAPLRERLGETARRLAALYAGGPGRSEEDLGERARERS
jgi:predicted DNA-binding transcriptional regulator YafY